MFKIDVGLNKSIYEMERSWDGNCFLFKIKLLVFRFLERLIMVIYNRDIEEYENWVNILKDVGENGEFVLFFG